MWRNVGVLIGGFIVTEVVSNIYSSIVGWLYDIGMITHFHLFSFVRFFGSYLDFAISLFAGGLFIGLLAKTHRLILTLLLVSVYFAFGLWAYLYFLPHMLKDVPMPVNHYKVLEWVAENLVILVSAFAGSMLGNHIITRRRNRQSN